MSRQYWSVDELVHSDYASRHNIDNTPADEGREKLQAFIDAVLQPVRVQWGRPILCTSGYRSPELNRAIGGARNSQHCRYEAVDLVPANGDADGLYRLIRQMHKAGKIEVDQAIRESADANREWVHLSYSPGSNRSEFFRMISNKVTERYHD